MKSIFWPILLLTLLLILGAIGLSPNQPADPPRYLPWQIEALTDGSIRVFGIHIGQTSLAEAERLFKEPVKLALFIDPDGHRSVEGFFSHLNLDGLSAKMVVQLNLDPIILEGIYNRGVRVKTLAVGRRQIELSDPDQAYLKKQPIQSLTYLPRIDLSPSMVQKRFGPPDQIIQKKNIQHWLYPQKGLDIALHPEGKDVLQYIAPYSFQQLKQPLNAQ